MSLEKDILAAQLESALNQMTTADRNATLALARRIAERPTARGRACPRLAVQLAENDLLERRRDRNGRPTFA